MSESCGLMQWYAVLIRFTVFLGFKVMGHTCKLQVTLDRPDCWTVCDKLTGSGLIAGLSAISLQEVA